MTAAVHKLETGADDAQAGTEVPDFQVSVSANFADLAQTQIMMPIKGAGTRAEANRRMDLAVDLALRQVSRQEIRLNEMALRDKRAALALQHKRKAEATAEFEAGIQKIEGEIADQLAKHEQIAQQAAAQHAASGRQGDYVPVGHVKKQLEAIGRGIADRRQRVQDQTKSQAQLVDKTQGDLITKLEEEIKAIERALELHHAIVG